MKIFYAIQATGNGHISRAIELMPYLQQYGEVDVFLSGSNSNLNASLPVKFRSKGASLFYGNKGGLDYWKMLKEFSPYRIWQEAKALPLEKYDIVINDFDCITSLACKIKKVKAINFGHQASFISSKTPRPKHKDFAGELVLKKYAVAEKQVGLHFEQYDNFIFPPIIKSEILNATLSDKGHITVYLSHYSDQVVKNSLSKIANVQFEVFSKKVKCPTVAGNITFLPIDGTLFNESMIHSHGVITGAGFETPAEALYLGKKLICLPIKGQYEQLCNAEALKRFGVPIINSITDSFSDTVLQWLTSAPPKKLTLSHSTYDIVQHVIEAARGMKQDKNIISEMLLNEEDWLAIG
jgi:uncharacterized protein (TIGR00661 family)